MRMLTGLSGPTLSLAPKDEHDFDDVIVDEEGRTEAQRLQLAGYAEPVLVRASVEAAAAAPQASGPTYDPLLSLPGSGDLVHDLARSDLSAAPALAAIEVAPAPAPVRRPRKPKA